MNYEFYMKRALELAKLGWGKTNPNPLVGAVIVKDDRIIGEGYHEKLGSAHAEVNAIKNSTESILSSTMYVNLEPCSHFGRTPPCVNAIIESGIKKVVISMIDPNPQVSGCGVKILQDAGIKVITNVLENEAKKLNDIFIKYITTKKPFVIMKVAMTLDGKIATYKGDSKWISNEMSREYVHKIRDRVSSIMVGIHTVINDNPFLTVRINDKIKQNGAKRIVIDPKGKIPIESNILNKDANTIIVTTSLMDIQKENLLMYNANEKNASLKILKCDSDPDNLDLDHIMNELYKLNIDSVLLEGGGTLNSFALKAGIVDKVMVFIAPKIVGDKDALTPVEGHGIELMDQAIRVENIEVLRFEDDILIEGSVLRREIGSLALSLEHRNKEPIPVSLEN